MEINLKRSSEEPELIELKRFYFIADGVKFVVEHDIQRKEIVITKHIIEYKDNTENEERILIFPYYSNSIKIK